MCSPLMHLLPVSVYRVCIGIRTLLIPTCHSRPPASSRQPHTTSV